MAQAPAPGGFDVGADDFAIIPRRRTRNSSAARTNFGRGEMRAMLIGACPREGVHASRR
jgi:hypothetical protein